MEPVGLCRRKDVYRFFLLRARQRKKERKTLNRKLPLQALIEAAIIAALAYIIDVLPAIEPFPWVKISIAMIPVLLLSLRWGWKAGMASGFVWGLLQIVLGTAYVLTLLQAFIEYFIAFSFIGLAGLFAGCLARYFWHFLAG